MATFDAGADKTLDAVRAIYAQRGEEYGDSWRLENMTTTFTEAVLRRMNVQAAPTMLRLLQLASLVDVKESRLKNGPYKQDSVIDGIAYRALFDALWERPESSQPQVTKKHFHLTRHGDIVGENGTQAECASEWCQRAAASGPNAQAYLNDKWVAAPNVTWPGGAIVDPEC